MEKVSDEMLMAFVDGELDEQTAAAVGKAVAADAALAARAERFRATRRLMREAYPPLSAEPMPEALLATLHPDRVSPHGTAPAGRVIAFPRLSARRAALPLAASLLLAVGIGSFLLGRAGVPTPTPALLGQGAVAEALGGLRSGEAGRVAYGAGEARLTALSTYRVAGGLCRSFELAAGAASAAGVGCDRGGGWRVEIAAAAPEGGYAPASDAALQGIDAFLDALEASAPLTAEEEASR